MCAIRDALADIGAAVPEELGNQIAASTIDWQGLTTYRLRLDVQYEDAGGVLQGYAEGKALEVDHIVPRNQGGTDYSSNLQALCYSCNSMKRDRDDTDFRGIAQSYEVREGDCLFCEMDNRKYLSENELCYATRDINPVTPHHALIIPKRHVPDFFDLYQPEINAVYNMLGTTRK